MTESTFSGRIVSASVLLLIAVLIAGCQPPTEKPSDQPKNVAQPAAESKPQPPAQPAAGVAEEPAAEPMATEPAATEPAATEPMTTEPAAAEPMTTEPAAAEPTKEPVPGAAEPAKEPAAGATDTRPGSIPFPPESPLPGPQPGALQVPSAMEPGEGPATDKPVDLGPPLVDNVAQLTRLDPVRPLWLDAQQKRVVMVAQVCQTNAPLELFACLRETKEHEAILTVDVEAYKVHTGLLACGANPGSSVKFDPYTPATGAEIEVTVVWKDDKGQRQTARGQDWVFNTQTQKAMTYPWVFGGSAVWVDETTGQKHYQAEGGDFICVSNFSSAMLDLPIESSQANSALMFKAFTERIPPLGTPVTLILTPKPAETKAKPAEAEAKPAEAKPAEAKP